MDVLTKATRLESAGRDIIHMEVGEPAFGAPGAAFDALETARKRGDTMGYTSGLGIQPLRAAIAALYASRYGIEIDPERVIVTAGSSAGFVLTFLALFDKGERVAIADPGYPCYRNILSILGLDAVRIRSVLESRYQPTPDHLAQAGKLDGLLVASPANPTGTMLDRPAMQSLVEACRAREIALISDEIYHGLTYETSPTSALELTDEVIVINSFSKYYAMTGWRIGWMVVPERFVRPIQNLAQSLFICPSHASQIAALGALSEHGEAEVARHLDVYRHNRSMVVTTLMELGFPDLSPCDGAFYAYAGLPSGFEDSSRFCSRLLDEAGVACTPGLDFDPDRGAGTVRFSFAQSPERIAEGLKRLRRFVEQAS